jgi:hypothetical protein
MSAIIMIAGYLEYTASDAWIGYTLLDILVQGNRNNLRGRANEQTESGAI